MIRRCLFAALSLALLSGIAHAQGKQPYVPWSGDFEEAVKEAEARNLPIVVFFLRDNDDDCEKWQREIIRDPVLIKHVEEFALGVVAAKETHYENEVIDPRTGETLKVCSIYKTIPCAKHIAAARQAGKALKFEQEPMAFVCDSSGAEVFKMNSLIGGEYKAAIDEVIKKSGLRPLTGSALRKLEAGLLKGDAKLSKGKFRDALKAYTKTLEDEKTPELVKARAQARLDALQAAVFAAVEEAKALEPNKAKGALKKLAKEVEGFEQAKAALDAALSELGG